MNSRHFTAITTHTFSSQNEDCLYILIRISFFYYIICSNCPGIVLVFASHQYCFCVVKICGHCVHIKHIKKVRSAGKVFCSSQGWTRTNTGSVMC